MSTWLQLWIGNGLTIAIAMFILWLVSLKLKNASIVDCAWGLLFTIIAWLSLHLGTTTILTAQLLVAGLTTIWGTRLSIHILLRNRGHGEDYRYAAWRSQAGQAFWWRSLFQVFWLQGLLALIIATPLYWNALYRIQAGPWLIVGCLAAVIGIAIEAIADAQLQRFKANPQNRGLVMQQGLWRFSRHPNYFGDALVWWGLGLTALDLPDGVLALLGPALMTYFLTNVSGVPLLEQRLLANKPDYAAYAKRTSAFVPWPPQKNVVIVLAVVLVLWPQTSTAARSESLFVHQKILADNVYELRGDAVYRHWGVIKIFAAGLYSPPGVNNVYPSSNVKKLLELRYFVAIDAEDFAQITREGVHKVVGPTTYQQLEPRIESFNRLYRNIAPGDRYALAYDPQQGTTLYWNDIVLGVIPGQDFASALFGIWLSEQSLDPRFRERLLHQR